MIRPTPEERVRFSERCASSVCAAARALRDRFKELGIRAPFSDDDAAWCDLADVALRGAKATGKSPADLIGEAVVEGNISWGTEELGRMAMKALEEAGYTIVRRNDHGKE
jgi:hypothetical protein